MLMLAGLQDSESALSRLGGCLYCLRTDQPPSIEHFVNLALGPHAADMVLPAGAVCNPCNQLLGRQVDEALVHLFEVQLIRGIFRIPDRRGRTIDELPLGNGRVLFSEDGSLKIEIIGLGHIREKPKNSVLVNLIAKRRNSGEQWRRATRSILKMGLGLVYRSAGAPTALSATYDDLRAAIFGDAYEGYLLIGEFELLRWPSLSASLIGDLPGIGQAARLQYGGLDLIADLSLGPASDVVRGWARDNGYEVMDISSKRTR